MNIPVWSRPIPLLVLLTACGGSSSNPTAPSAPESFLGGTWRGTVTIEVEDNGVGLPAKDRDRLTEPYVTTREKGTGLGLAIVKRILEDHGGELELTDARSGQGALAILRLPAAPASSVEAQAVAVST